MRRTDSELIDAFTARAVSIAQRKKRRRLAWIGAMALMGLLVAGETAAACKLVCVAYGGKVYCRCR